MSIRTRTRDTDRARHSCRDCPTRQRRVRCRDHQPPLSCRTVSSLPKRFPAPRPSFQPAAFARVNAIMTSGILSNVARSDVAHPGSRGRPVRRGRSRSEPARRSSMTTSVRCNGKSLVQEPAFHLSAVFRAVRGELPNRGDQASSRAPSRCYRRVRSHVKDRSPAGRDQPGQHSTAMS